MPQEVTAYKCEFCSNLFRFKGKRLDIHEKTCPKNPKNKFICRWCTHFDYKRFCVSMCPYTEEPIYKDAPLGHSADIEVPFCTKRQVGLLGHREIRDILRKIIPYGSLDYCYLQEFKNNQPLKHYRKMRIKCEHYKAEMPF